MCKSKDGNNETYLGEKLQELKDENQNPNAGEKYFDEKLNELKKEEK